MAIKHIGRLKTNKRKVAVAYRTIPNDAHSALIVSTENLTDSDHDILMQMVESSSGQSANELAEAMARTRLSDGSIMLSKFHSQGKLVKVPTSDVLMTPDNNTSVSLDELNKIIAEQKGVSIDDLAIKEGGSETKAKPAVQAEPVTVDPSAPSGEAISTSSDGVLSDADLAKQYRSQADRLSKEAAQLRRDAEELVPTKKKSKE